jgi:hypothetical protein
MDELMSILRSMRTDADQAIQLLTSGKPATGSKAILDAAAILDRLKTWRDELDRLIDKHGDPRDERA